MPTPRGPRVAKAGVGLAVAAAIVAGTLVARDQLVSTSAVNTASTLSDRNGTLQGLVHTGPIKKGHPFVPFLGPFRRGQCGPAVRLMEVALKRKRIRHTPPRNCVGPATVRQIKAFQRSVHYKQTGVYTRVVHLRMVKANGYTNEGRRDLIYLAHKVVIERERHNVSVIAAHAFLVGGSLPYTQGPARSYFPPWPRLPPSPDCSSFATWIAWQAGFGPAVGFFAPGLSVVGWTGTLALQGHVVGPNQPLAIGDFVFYPSDRAPRYPWGHVAVYIGHNLVISHGSPGVKELPFNYRAVGEVRRMIA